MCVINCIINIFKKTTKKLITTMLNLKCGDDSMPERGRVVSFNLTVR
jgi:hypothetical protein